MTHLESSSLPSRTGQLSESLCENRLGEGDSPIRRRRIGTVPGGSARAGQVNKRVLLVLGSLGVLGTCLAVRYFFGPAAATAKGPIGTPADGGVRQAAANIPAPTAEETKTLTVMANVNGEEITRTALADECLRHYGTEVLEILTNKQVITEACDQRKIRVTEREIDDEIDRLARKFSLPKEQWMKMLQTERGIKPQQYRQDIIWPTIALRKLAADNLVVSKAELEKAFESQFGEAIRVRLIAVKNLEVAQMVRAKAVAQPDEFGALARQYSLDVNSASANGLIPPIRRHLGPKDIEDVVFNMQPGDISKPVKVGDQYAIFKCEQRDKPMDVDRAKAHPLLEDALRERKLRSEAGKVFENLQKQVVVQNVLNDPAKSQRYPGVAALVNARPITLRELSDECIARHGNDVLDGMINRRLIEHAVKKKRLPVTQGDLDAEIARAAASMGRTTSDGKPDVDGWVKAILKDQRISYEIYLRDSVWPSVAMKKLVGQSVVITEEDLQRGFEANYGPRVRCRAVILSNARKAQEVWELARKTPTVEYFSKLAEEYSIEANSRSLKGEIPPIQRYGGQDVLEKQAFALKPGELSGIVQVGQNYVILLCEGYTKPDKVTFKDVRKDIYEDLHEKKLRLAMGKEFERLKKAAQIDNYLAGTMKAPEQDLSQGPSVKSALQK